MKLFRNMISRKIVPLCFTILFAAFNTYAVKFDKKMFFYASDLPSKIENKYYELRKNVIDVALATQMYELVFSEIPNHLANSKLRQYILKYKLRTDGFNSYRIELFLIDADAVKIIRTKSTPNVKQDNLIYEFRLSLYEFILNRELREKEAKDFLKQSQSKIRKIRRSTPAKLPPKNRPKLVEILKKRLETIKENEQLKNNTFNKGPIVGALTNSLEKTSSDRPGLWDLLKDDDKDKPWTPRLINRDIPKGAKDSWISKRTNFKTLNPFNFWAQIKDKTEEEQRIKLSTNQYHFAWKYVQRDLIVKDILNINNSFKSVISFTGEWIHYMPLHISPLLFRVGFEIDRPYKTTPIDLGSHYLFRVGAGYRVNNWFLPSLYFERSDLIYGNLNVRGEGIEDNFHSVQWLSFEPAFMGYKTYLSIHFAKSLNATKNGDTREKESPSGHRYGANIRYFFSNKYLGIKWWIDAEYRHELFTRENTDNTLEIDKTEYSTRIGFHY
jgi:hypothetical protein